MPRLLRISQRHQVTLPPGVMREAGLTEGSYVAVEARDGKIVLEPTAVGEESFSREDWEAMDKLVARQVRSKRYVEYADAKAAKKHLK